MDGQPMKRHHRTARWDVLPLAAWLLLAFSLLARPTPGHALQADLIVVEKSEQRMLLFKHGLVVREYPIALGFNPEGHKRHEGDGRTPEGRYELVWRNPKSAFYRALQISYPNEHDLEYAQMNELEPGGKIMIHGSPNWVPSDDWARQYLQTRNWTEGCIAVTNDVMDEIWYAVELGTPIEIRP